MMLRVDVRQFFPDQSFLAAMNFPDCRSMCAEGETSRLFAVGDVFFTENTRFATFRE
jgi:hypothetical protein